MVAWPTAPPLGCRGGRWRADRAALDWDRARPRTSAVASPAAKGGGWRRAAGTAAGMLSSLGGELRNGSSASRNGPRFPDRGRSPAARRRWIEFARASGRPRLQLPRASGWRPWPAPGCAARVGRPATSRDERAGPRAVGESPRRPFVGRRGPRPWHITEHLGQAAPVRHVGFLRRLDAAGSVRSWRHGDGGYTSGVTSRPWTPPCNRGQRPRGLPVRVDRDRSDAVPQRRRCRRVSADRRPKGSVFGYTADLAAALMSALGTNRVDVVVLNGAPPLLYHRVLRDGQRILVAQPPSDHDARRVRAFTLL